MLPKEKGRIQREKDFHNDVFVSDVRQPTDKYYKSTRQSQEFYRNLVLTGVKNKKVLEYGCGPGSLAFDLARNGADVYAIDISDVAIDLARKQARSEGLDIAFEVMDAENLSFKDHCFDVVCGTGILHHLDLKSAYSELQRVVKANGKTVFVEPLGHNPVITLYRKLTPAMRTEDEHPLLMSDIALAKSSFEHVDAHHFNLFATLSTFVPFLSSPLNSLDKVLFKIIPFAKKYSWIVVLEFSNPR